MLTKLKHQNIIRLLDSIQDPGGGWLLIMEYAAIGTLMDLVSRLVPPKAITHVALLAACCSCCCGGCALYTKRCAACPP